ncbi:MAG: DMT family transporter [Pseudomonadota bacterium]
MFQHSASQPRQTALGIGFALCGTALFTPVFAAGKLADGQVPVLVVIWMRYVGGVLAVVTAILATRTSWSQLRSPTPHWHAVRALFGVSGGACAIYAATALPVADATAIGLTEGLLIVALAAILLGEHVTPRHWLAGTLCAFGALIVVRGAVAPETTPVADPTTAWLGAGAAFLGALLIAIETILIKVLARRETALGVLIHVNLFGALLMIVPGWLAMSHSAITLDSALPFLLLGPLAITAQFFVILSLRLADAAIIGPVSYSWILFAALLGYIVFGEVPTLWTWAGGALIVAGGIWLARLK